MKTCRLIIAFAALCLFVSMLLCTIKLFLQTRKESVSINLVAEKTNQINQQAIVPVSNRGTGLKLTKVKDTQQVTPDSDSIRRSNVEGSESLARRQYLTTLRNTMRMQEAGTNSREGEFKIIIDPQRGRYATVSSNNIVRLREKNGRIVWSSDITEFVKTNRIYSVYLSGKQIIITLYMKREELTVDKETGRVGVIVY